MTFLLSSSSWFPTSPNSLHSGQGRGKMGTPSRSAIAHAILGLTIALKISCFLIFLVHVTHLKIPHLHSDIEKFEGKSRQKKQCHYNNEFDFSRSFSEEPNTEQKRPASAIREGQRSYSDNYTSNWLQPRPPEKPRAQSAKTRVKTSSSRLADKRQSAALSAKLAASGKHATNIMGSLAEGGARGHEWQHSPAPIWEVASGEGRGGRVSPASTRYTPVNVFACASCDKMYNTQKDLDIHKSFCYGRVNENYA